ncbi:MAG: ABC transporter ATP-binding protein [Synergistaceae bacterium]|jgi:ABC-2 type transport system ATP-binding protein|nr:ABC transporter ATP-binding protein [Synergistaceae bacterium]MCK9436012.1 ABC transporter ATP-binding protein [Synergistaceae bacterium]MDD2350485.1 ABC transporter ATP-binding protein [Synergistaceae bacterium]MDD3319097.1 ABC transporter ATP-binding protein [Synergistaceae bacterium]MDD3963578.1 ABC transporter ATP-binding protein [Synergistaceae bacterium]
MKDAEQEICLSYKGVGKKFKNISALDDVYLEVCRGEIFGFIGPDGAGKTTLIRMAMGITNPDRGECTLLGSTDRRKARKNAGYVPQLFSLYTDMTVNENIALFGSLYGTSREIVLKRAEAILKRTGLWPFRERMVGKLSGGMKQKLALASGLMHTPEILFLDEPTTGVDPVARREFWAMLYELNREGLTIIVSTPYMDEAELCTRKMFIDNGKILDVGTSEELLSRFDNKILKLELDERRAKEWLLKCANVRDANLFGSSYHIVVDDVASATREIRKELAMRYQEHPELYEITPNLEDLFVAFSGGTVSCRR